MGEIFLIKADFIRFRQMEPRVYYTCYDFGIFLHFILFFPIASFIAESRTGTSVVHYGHH